MALHTHIATIRLLPNNGGVDAVLDARYVLRNDNKEPAGVQVQLPASQGAGAALAVDGEPLALQPGDNDMVAAQMTVPADGSVDLDLTFTAHLDGPLLAQVRYPVELLNQWPGQRSLRVDIQPD